MGLAPGPHAPDQPPRPCDPERRPPGAVGSSAARGTPGSTATHPRNTKHTPLPTTGPTRSVPYVIPPRLVRPGGTFGANARKMAGTAAGLCTDATARA